MKTLLMLASLMATMAANGQEVRKPRKIDTIQVIRIERAIPTVCPLTPSIPNIPFKKIEPGSYTFNREELRCMPYTQINDIVATVGGVYQRQRGADVQIYGSRSSGSTYFLDGMMMR